MKIVFLCQSLTVGGTQRQVTVLATALKRRGHDVSVTTFYGNGPFFAELKAADVPIHDLHKRNRWDVFGFLSRLLRLLRRERPDVIYSLLPIPNAMAAIIRPMLRPAPCLVFGVRSARVAGESYDWLTHRQYRLEAILSGAASLVITNSNAGYRDAEARGFRSRRMVVIPNGIDTAKFTPDPIAGGRVRAEWGVRAGEFLVGLVARFDPMKGHEIFFAAGAQLVNADLSWRFVAIGINPGEEQARAQRLAEAYGLGSRIIWAGVRPDMPICLAALDVACLASRFGEGFPNVIAEAMACGVPCVVTDVGDSREIVDGYGVVVPPGDAGALASGLHRLRERLIKSRPEIAISARQSIIDRFGAEVATERTERELTAILN